MYKIINSCLRIVVRANNWKRWKTEHRSDGVPNKKTRTHTRLFFITMIWKREKKTWEKNVSVRLNAMENHAIAQIFREYKIQQQRLYMTVATTSNCSTCEPWFGRMRQISGHSQTMCTKCDGITLHNSTKRFYTMQANISYQPNIINNQNKIYNLPYFLYSSKFILNANTRILLIWLWLRPLFCFIYICMCRLPFDALGFC